MGKSEERWEILVDGINKAVAEKNMRHLDELVFETGIILLEEGFFPPPLFGGILQLVRKKEFLSLKKSRYLLKLFEENADLLSERQKADLIGTLESVFDAFDDLTSCFLAAEIIAELFADESSLQVLRNLKSVRNGLKRALVPHGFQWFIKRCQNSVLIKQAFDELADMRNDPDKNVRTEAEAEIRRTGRNIQDMF